MGIWHHVVTNLCGTVQVSGWENKDKSLSSESFNSFIDYLIFGFVLLATKGLETEAP